MKINSNAPPSQPPGESGKSKPASTKGSKDFDSVMQETEQGSEEGGENVAPGTAMGEKMKMAKPPIIPQQGGLQKGTESFQRPGTEMGKSGKAFGSLMDQAATQKGTAEKGSTEKGTAEKSTQKDVRMEQFGSQGLPLASYLEPAAQVKNVEAPARAGLPISEIEKLVDRVSVGVNASGDPEFKVDLHMKELGDLNVRVTRTDQGLQIHLNAETEKAGLQLGQNLPNLQAALAQKGLQVSDIQFLVQNQPIPISELNEARPYTDSRVSRKDSAVKAGREKTPRTIPPPKGR